MKEHQLFRGSATLLAMCAVAGMLIAVPTPAKSDTTDPYFHFLNTPSVSVYEGGYGAMEYKLYNGYNRNLTITEPSGWAYYPSGGDPTDTIVLTTSDKVLDDYGFVNVLPGTTNLDFWFHTVADSDSAEVPDFGLTTANIYVQATDPNDNQFASVSATGTGTIKVVDVPEPESLTMALTLGLVTSALYLRRRRAG